MDDSENSMIVEEEWTEKDFDEMGWHDSSIHAIGFPQGELELKFDIDYIFKWVLEPGGRRFSFWVAPCTLTFFNVSDLNFDIDRGTFAGLDIMDITRSNPRSARNGDFTVWDYVVETDHGKITFDATGFLQQVRRQPVHIRSQTLGRRSWGEIKDGE